MKVIHFFFLTQTDSYNEAIAFYRQSLEDNEIEKEINGFNTTINNVYTTYYDGGEFEFPSPEIISNGQRDILTLVTQLLMAKRFIKKNYGIIVIDEVFDYLDESNIIAAQYYILKMINEFKRANKKVYFLLLTHVDPMYYVTYRYLHGGENDTSLINVVYLGRNVMSDKCKEEIQYFKKILNARNASDTELNPKLNKYYFHFSSESIDELDFSELFIERSLHNGWAKPKDFINYCNNEIKKYSESKEYNPFAVACFLRYMIEKIVFEKLPQEKKKKFEKDTSETLRKLWFAQNTGVEIDSSYYLLAYIYNPYEHIENVNYHEEDLRIESEIALYSKLNNLQIKKMIFSIYEEYSKLFVENNQ